MAIQLTPILAGSIVGSAAASVTSTVMGSALTPFSLAGMYSMFYLKPIMLPGIDMLFDAWLRLHPQDDPTDLVAALRSQGVDVNHPVWQFARKYSLAYPGLQFSLPAYYFAKRTNNQALMEEMQNLAKLARAEMLWWEPFLFQIWFPYTIHMVTDWYIRGLIDAFTYRETLGNLWIPADHPLQKAMYYSGLVVPGVSDLIRFMVRDTLNPNIVQKFGYDEEYPAAIETWLRAQGMGYTLSEHPLGKGWGDLTWGKLYWRAHWVLPSPTQAQDMMVLLRPNRAQRLSQDLARVLGNPGGIWNDIAVTPAEAADLLKIADYPPYWRGRLLALAYRPMTQRLLQQTVTEEVPDPVPLEERIADLGFLPTEVIPIAEMFRSRALQQRASRGEMLSVREGIRMYAEGILSAAELDVVLDANGLQGNRKALARNRAEVLRRRVLARQFERVARRAFLNRFVNEAQARNALINSGFDPAFAEAKVNQWVIERSTIYRRQSAAQVLEEYRMGLITAQQAMQDLQQLGYDGDNALRMVRKAWVKAADKWLRQLQSAYRAWLREAERLLARQRRMANEARRLAKEQKIEYERALREVERRYKEAEEQAKKQFEEWEKQAKEKAGQEPQEGQGQGQPQE
jgi:hypothetical protein